MSQRSKQKQQIVDRTLPHAACSMLAGATFCCSPACTSRTPFFVLRPTRSNVLGASLHLSSCGACHKILCEWSALPLFVYSRLPCAFHFYARSCFIFSVFLGSSSLLLMPGGRQPLEECIPGSTYFASTTKCKTLATRKVAKQRAQNIENKHVLPKLRRGVIAIIP